MLGLQVVLGLRFGAGAATSGAGAGAPVAPALATGLDRPKNKYDFVLEETSKNFTVQSRNTNFQGSEGTEGIYRAFGKHGTRPTWH